MNENLFKDYKPVRILDEIVVAGISDNILAGQFPNAESYVVGGKGAKTDTISRIFKAGKVVDAPTSEERLLFETVSKKFVAIIPQHKDGFDDPRSNLARSRAGSDRGRQIFLRLQASKRAESKKSKPVTHFSQKREGGSN